MCSDLLLRAFDGRMVSLRWLNPASGFEARNAKEHRRRSTPFFVRAPW